MTDEPKDIVERLRDGVVLVRVDDHIETDDGATEQEMLDAADVIESLRAQLEVANAAIASLRALLAAERAEVEARRALVQAIRRRVDAFAIRPYHESVCDAEVATDAARREFGG